MVRESKLQRLNPRSHSMRERRISAKIVLQQKDGSYTHWSHPSHLPLPLYERFLPPKHILTWVSKFSCRRNSLLLQLWAKLMTSPAWNHLHHVRRAHPSANSATRIHRDRQSFILGPSIAMCNKNTLYGRFLQLSIIFKLLYRFYHVLAFVLQL